MSGRKFEVGNTYEGRATGNRYECLASGRTWAILQNIVSGAEDVEKHGNIALYMGVVPKKTGTKFLLVYVYRTQPDGERSASFSDRKSLDRWVEVAIDSITILAIKEVPWTEGDGVGETKKD